MIDLVAADADPAKLKDEIAITVIVARTLDFFILLAPLHALVICFLQENLFTGHLSSVAKVRVLALCKVFLTSQESGTRNVIHQIAINSA